MPRSKPLALCCLLACLALLAPPSAAEDAVGPERRLIDAKAASVVSLKFVLQITMEMGGQVREMERNGSALGVVVDPAGLIMVRASAFEARVAPRGGRGRRGGGGRAPNVTATPTNIRVVIPGVEKEHVGIMGAKDSKSGLAFVLVKGLAAGTKLAAADLAKAATPKVGQDLYAVSRLGQGFDHAAFCDRVRVIGKVTKPKSLWLIDDRGAFVGLPLYTAAGAVAGVVVVQEGVGEGAGSRAFLVPLDAAQRTIASAVKEAERIRDEWAEAAEEAAEEKQEPEKKDAPDK